MAGQQIRRYRRFLVQVAHAPATISQHPDEAQDGFATIWVQAAAAGVPLPGDRVSTGWRGSACEQDEAAAFMEPSRSARWWPHPRGTC